jgi:CheY-like chemotaxis protein
MPREDGYSLIRKIRLLEPEQGGQIPAIALTIFAGEENSNLSMEAGFQVHLVKPIEPAELVRVVAALATRF